MIHTIERLRTIGPGETIVYYRGPTPGGPAPYVDLLSEVFTFARMLKHNGRVQLVEKDIKGQQGPGTGMHQKEYIAIGI